MSVLKQEIQETQLSLTNRAMHLCNMQWHIAHKTLPPYVLPLTLTLTYFLILRTPLLRPRAQYIVIISYVLFGAVGLYVRLKRNVFSPRRKTTVDFVLFSSVGSWFHVRGAAVENARSAIFRFVRGTT